MSHGWVRDGFDGITILVNTSVTIVGMYLGTVAWRTTASEQESGRAFFRAPVRPAAAVRSPDGEPHQSPIAKMTIAVGLLLAVAGLMVDELSARVIDLSVASALLALGVTLHRKTRRAEPAEVPPDGVDPGN